MLLHKDRKRRLLQWARLAVAVSVISVIFIGCTSNGDLEVSLSEDATTEMDGLYITFSGDVTIRNTMNSGVDDAAVELYLRDVKEDKMVSIWKGEHVCISPNSTATIHINFRISSFSVCAAIINSLQTVNSPLEIHVDVAGKCIYNLIDADVDADIGIRIAEEGKVLKYIVDKNTASEYRLSVVNLSDYFIPDDNELTISSGDTNMAISTYSDDLGLHMEVTSNKKLDDAIDILKDNVDSAVTKSGDEIDKDTAKYIVSAIGYARWFL